VRERERERERLGLAEQAVRIEKYEMYIIFLLKLFSFGRGIKR
jgi:hypothetical protein